MRFLSKFMKVTKFKRKLRYLWLTSDIGLYFEMERDKKYEKYIK